MIENNSLPVSLLPGTSLEPGASPSLPSGIVPPHMMLGKGASGSQDQPVGRAPMKEYMDRVTDKRKWEDVRNLECYLCIVIRVGSFYL